MEQNKANIWGLMGILAGLYLLYDNINGGPLHVSLVLHEVGHWIFATLFTLEFAQIKFYFYEGSGLCSFGPTFIPFGWIIAIMGVGFQNIVGALLWGLIPARGAGQFFRRTGMGIYFGGFLDISFGEPHYTMMLYGDFGQQTIIKLILLIGLNYYLVRRIILGQKSARKISDSHLVREFLYQSGIRNRPCRNFSDK